MHMMIHRMLPFLVALASPAVAEVVPLSQFAADDGPWIEVAEDATFTAEPTSYADIVAMADLDGNPDVLTAKEQEMIAVLTQVLGATPISY